VRAVSFSLTHTHIFIFFKNNDSIQCSTLTKRSLTRITTKKKCIGTNSDAWHHFLSQIMTQTRRQYMKDDLMLRQYADSMCNVLKKLRITLLSGWLYKCGPAAEHMVYRSRSDDTFRRRRFHSVVTSREVEPAEKIIAAFGCMLARQRHLQDFSDGVANDRVFRSTVTSLSRVLQCDSITSSGYDPEQIKNWSTKDDSLSTALRLVKNEQDECINMFTHSGSPLTIMKAEQRAAQVSDTRVEEQPKWFREWYQVLTHTLSEEKEYLSVCDEEKTTEPMRIRPGEIRNRLLLIYNDIVDSIDKLYPDKRPDFLEKQTLFLDKLPLKEMNDMKHKIWSPDVKCKSRLNTSREKKEVYFRDGRKLCASALKTLRIVILSGFLWKSSQKGEYNAKNAKSTLILRLGKILAYRYFAEKVPGLFTQETCKNFDVLGLILKTGKLDEKQIPKACKSPTSNFKVNQQRPPSVRIWNIGPIGVDSWMLSDDQVGLANALREDGYKNMIDIAHETMRFREWIEREKRAMKDFAERKNGLTPRKIKKSLRSDLFTNMSSIKPPKGPAPLPLKSSHSMPTPSVGIMFTGQGSDDFKMGKASPRMYSSEDDEKYNPTDIHSIYRELVKLESSKNYIQDDKTKGHMRFQFDVNSGNENITRAVYKRNRLIAIHNTIVSIVYSLKLSDSDCEDNPFFRYIPTDYNILNNLPSKSLDDIYWAPEVMKKTQDHSKCHQELVAE